MQKKIFLQKKNNLRSGGKPLVKMLLWGALIFVILVAVTPLISRQKNHKDTAKKATPEKGAVVREVPKTPEPAQPASPPREGAGAKTVKGAIPGIESTPVPQEPPPGTPEQGQMASAKDSAMEEGAGNAQKGAEWMEVKPASPLDGQGPAPAPTASNQPKQIPVPVPAPAPEAAAQPEKQIAAPEKPKAPEPSKASNAKKQKVASVAPATAKKPEKKPAAQGTPDSRADAAAENQAKKPAPGGKQSYTIQVGSFKDKKNAEELQQHLQKRGYAVSLKPTPHPKLGEIYVVLLQPVDNMSKASTLVEQIRHEEKVKPIILKGGKE